MKAVRFVSLAILTVALAGTGARAQVSYTPGALSEQDTVDIRRLWSEYQRALFACDGDGYADLFATPGGYFASAPRGEVRERQALVAMTVGYDRCKPGAKLPAEAAPRSGAAPGTAAAAPLPVPVIEAAPEGARARIVNSRGGGYYDDVYVRTPAGWKFKSRTVITDAELAAGLTARDFVEIRALAGDDHGHYDDVYGQPDGEIRPLALSKPGEPFRTSGLRLTLGKDGTVNGLAYLRNNGGRYEDVYVKTPQGWRIKERTYFKP